VFIVQGKPPEPEGIVKVVAKTRLEALQAANNLLKQSPSSLTAASTRSQSLLARSTRETSRFAHVAVNSSAGLTGKKEAAN